MHTFAGFFSLLSKEYILRNRFISTHTSKSHADWFAHEQCNKMHSPIGKCDDGERESEPSSHENKAIDSWKMKLHAHIQPSSSLFLCQLLNAMICEILKLFVVSPVVLYFMIDMRHAVMFSPVKSSTTKPHECRFFHLSIEWHLLCWDDIYTGFVYLPILFGDDELCFFI